MEDIEDKVQEGMLSAFRGLEGRVHPKNRWGGQEEGKDKFLINIRDEAKKGRKKSQRLTKMMIPKGSTMVYQLVYTINFMYEMTRITLMNPRDWCQVALDSSTWISSEEVISSDYDSDDDEERNVRHGIHEVGDYFETVQNRTEKVIQETPRRKIKNAFKIEQMVAEHEATIKRTLKKKQGMKIIETPSEGEIEILVSPSEREIELKETPSEGTIEKPKAPSEREIELKEAPSEREIELQVTPSKRETGKMKALSKEDEKPTSTASEIGKVPQSNVRETTPEINVSTQTPTKLSRSEEKIFSLNFRSEIKPQLEQLEASVGEIISDNFDSTQRMLQRHLNDMEEARLALRRTESFLLKRESKRKEKRKEPTRYMKIKSLIAWMLKSFAYVIGIEQIASEKVINDFETAEQFKDYCHVNGCYTMADFLGYKGMSREWDVYEEEYLSDANEELQMIIEKFTNKSWILQCQNSYCRENDLKLEYSERVEGLPLLMTMLKPKDVLATGYTVAMSELIGLQYSEPKSRPDGGVMFMSKLANKVNIALLEEKKLDQIIRAGQLKKLLLTVQIKESGKAKETLQYIEENPNKTFDEIYKWANASNSQKIATSRISKKSKKKDSAIREANVIERKNDKKPKGNSKEKGTYDKSKVECFNCGEFGHYKNECTNETGKKKHLR